MKFDVKIFLIIMILTFLLAYKLTDYAANFNTIKKESRIEIIFLAIFFVFLFIPMSHINQDKISINENRLLRTWEPLIKKDGQINFDFGKYYNGWFNDRFNFRRFFTDVHTNITLLLTKKAQKGFIDKNGFIYMNFEVDNYHQLKKINKYDYDALVKFNNYLKERNIELYVLLVPYKGTIIYPPTKKLMIKDIHTQNIDNKTKKLNKDYDMHIINSLNAMKEESKNNYVFFKTEHHWTDDGAFASYKELMKEITKKHPDISVLKEEDFNISYNTKIRGDWDRNFQWGESSQRTNMPLKYKKELHKTEYRYFTHKDSKLLKTKIVNISRKRAKYFTFPNGADYKVILLGTSMNEILCEFIPYTFKNVLRLRTNGVKNIEKKDEFKYIKYYKKEIMDYNPDIIILCISYFDMIHLKDLFKME